MGQIDSQHYRRVNKRTERMMPEPDHYLIYLMHSLGVITRIRTSLEHDLARQYGFPVENLQKGLNSAEHKRPAGNLAELEAFCQKEWNKTPTAQN